jgi:hypothetical protein
MENEIVFNDKIYLQVAKYLSTITEKSKGVNHVKKY